MCWLCLTTGWSTGRLLLGPICLYFVLFSVAARRASRDYLTAVLGRPARLQDVFRHYHAFAATILDRVFFLTGRFEEYQIGYNGLAAVDAQAQAGRGFLLIGAHLGSFEVLHTLGANRAGLPIKALMDPEATRQVGALRADLNPELVSNIIPLGSPTAMLEAKEHLDYGGVIGMLADRTTRENKSVRTTFLGRPARLPEGPWLLASLLKVPVLLMFGLYMGGRRYEIHFEHFADQVTVGRESRDADLQGWVDRYAGRLEHYCRLAPYNWFNFYAFWEPHDLPS